MKWVRFLSAKWRIGMTCFLCWGHEGAGEACALTIFQMLYLIVILNVAKRNEESGHFFIV